MKKTLLIGISLALLAVAAVQRQRLETLRAANQTLTREAADAGSVPPPSSASAPTLPAESADEIARLREENRELLKLRNEVRQLREQKPKLLQARTENERLKALITVARNRATEPPMQPIVFTPETFSNA